MLEIVKNARGIQMSTDEIKKIRKFLPFNNASASSPRISRKVTFSPLLLGGVLGRVKLKSPSAAEAMDTIKKVYLSIPSARASGASHANTRLITKPEMIHPSVPNTRMPGNCFSGSFIWKKEMELTRARVGIYMIIYPSTYG